MRCTSRVWQGQVPRRRAGSTVRICSSQRSTANGLPTSRLSNRPDSNGVTKATMHWYGGVQTLVSGKARGQVFVSLVLVYRPAQLECQFATGPFERLYDFLLTRTHL